MNVEQPMKWVQPAANAKSKLTPNRSAMTWMIKKPLRAMTLPGKLTAMVIQNQLQSGQKMEKELTPKMATLPSLKLTLINTDLPSRELKPKMMLGNTKLSSATELETKNVLLNSPCTH